VWSKLGSEIRLRNLFLPRNNHWLRRTNLVFAFVLFDYFSTLAFCRIPLEEANMHARIFMENFGILLGLTLFVLIFNLPIYMTLSLDSHIVRFPPKIAIVFEVFVDAVFAWYVAGLHFNGGSSWFWNASDVIRQSFGAALYLAIAIPLIRPYHPRFDN
jgi:hypothetical protein